MDQLRSIENLDFRFGSSSSQTSQTSGDFCRICHESDAINPPLIAPCLCSGTLRFVHMTCLTQWLTASETSSCELCKFPFIMQSKIKPFNEWRSLEMSGVERRRLFCAVLFHLAAALCVIWSLCVLIERSAEEVRTGKLGWPFWTKLVVVTVGLTGGIVFMYIQCKQYLNLCSRWRARNRILLIQNAPEKSNNIPPRSPPSPLNNSNTSLHHNTQSGSFVISAPLPQSDHRQLQHQQSQIIANIENSSINYELTDEDMFSQSSFKNTFRHESLHNVYDNTSNTSGTIKGVLLSDNDFNLRMAPPMEEIENNTEHRNEVIGDKTSVFLSNNDILNDKNYYPKLRHSTLLLPTTARSIGESLEGKHDEKRRYSDTKLLNSFHVEVKNELLLKSSSIKVPTSPNKLRTNLNLNDSIFDKFDLNIQTMLELDSDQNEKICLKSTTNVE